MAVKEVISLAIMCLAMHLTGAFYSSEPTYHRCCASGDPHYYPFDGGVIHFQGTCRYLMAGTCPPCGTGNEEFDVYVENEAPTWNPSVSVTKAVEIHYKGWIVWLGRNGVFSMQPYGGGWQSLVSFPVGSTYLNIPDAIVTRLSYNHLVFETYYGITLEFSDNHRACVTVPCKYKSRMCGICGNLNGIMDDYVTSDGVDVSGLPNMATLIGNSWQVAPGEISQLPDHCNRPPVNIRTADYKPAKRNVGMCIHLQETTTSLASCIESMPELAEEYFDSCIFDLNAQTRIANAHCDTIEAFVRECQRLSGREMSNWRRELQCPCANNVYEDPCPRPERPGEPGVPGVPGTAGPA